MVGGRSHVQRVPRQAHSVLQRQPALRPAPGYRLPAFASTFVGRVDDVDRLVALLDADRLVTLVGPGGVGKTRLAVEVARRVAAERAFFVDLAHAAGLGSVRVEIGSAFGVGHQATADLPTAVAGRIGSETALLVLDGCEHVIEECAAAVHSLLERCEGLAVLATSRQPLEVPAERSWRLGCLPTPGDDSAIAESVQLFCDRAQAVRPDFVLGPDTTEAVREICRRLDGLPLAIELAASRLDSLALEEVAERLSDRFALLRAGGRTRPARHSSLQAVLDWSHTLLSEPEASLFRRLSVFPGSATFDAVDAVCGDAAVCGEDAGTLDVITGLVRKSLVVAEVAVAPSRYGLLDTIREYAAERLSEAGEADELRARHAAWCVGHLDAGAGSPCSGGACRCMGDGGSAREDGRAAMTWAVEASDAETALRLARAQAPRWWADSSYGEALGWLAKALDVPGDAPVELRAEVLGHAGVMATMIGDLDGAITFLEEELRLSAGSADAADRAGAISHLAFLSVLRDPQSGRQRLDESVELARASGDPQVLAFTLHGRGRALMFQRDVDAAAADFASSLEIAREADDTPAVASALTGVGWAALAVFDLERAEQSLDDALTTARRTGQGYLIALAVLWRGELSRLRGDHDDARQRLTTAVAMAEKARAPYPRAQALAGLGWLEHAEGDLSAATSRFDEALGLARQAGLRILEAPCLHGLADVVLATGDEAKARPLFEETLAVARACGDGVSAANAIAGLGTLARLERDHDQAVDLHHEALDGRHEAGDVLGVVQSLEALAVLAADAGHHDRAARLFGAVLARREERGLGDTAPGASERDGAIAAARKSLGAHAFQAACDAGVALSIEEAVGYARRARGTRTRGRPSSGWAALTPVERSVVELAADGLTNPEISERLFVSRETVKSHLSRSFTKLGVRSRRELAQAVAQR